MFKRLGSSLALAVGLLVISGCTSPVTPPDDTGTGSVRLTVLNSVADGRTILPELSMDVVSISVSGTGPHDLTYDSGQLELSEAAVTIEELWVGDWSITVEGLNEAGETVGSGTQSVTVEANVTKEVNVTITPLTGPGALSLSISLPNVEGLSIQGILNPPAGSEADPVTMDTFVIDGTMATYTGSTIEAGFYTLVLSLYDGEQLVQSVVTALRIVSGETTSGSLTFPPLNSIVAVTVGIEMPAAFTIQLTNTLEREPPFTMAIYETLTANASPSVEEEASYQWYLNGELLEGATGSEVVLNSQGGYELWEGSFTLTVVVQAGGALASESMSFTVDQGAA